MKQIRFWAQPFSQQELTTFVSDEDWISLQDHIDNGEPADFVFQQLWKSHEFKFGQTTILPHYEAFDLEITDCDCEETKKRPLTPKE